MRAAACVRGTLRPTVAAPAWYRRAVAGHATQTATLGGQHVWAAVIPCRAGSKRIPGKNVRNIAGRPLLLHVVDAALEAGIFPGGVHVVSDDSEALSLAETSGAGTIDLPHSEAQDDSPAVLALSRAAAQLKGGMPPELQSAAGICYLRATSPLVTAASIKEACSLFERKMVDTVVGVVEVTGAHPSRFKRIDASTGLLVDAFDAFPEGPVPARSETLRAYQRNSAVTVTHLNLLLAGSILGPRVLPMTMGEVESVDINTQLEWDLAELLLLRRQHSTV